ncbi:MAG: nicotinate phosphoribosyltransferase, partial [bacterium]
FARAHPDNTVLLVDTYDTEAGAAKVVALVPKLRSEGIQVRAVRLDSGDLAAHAHRVRRILDEGGCSDIRIFASGGLDEHELAKLAPAPIDGFGVGTALVVSDDAPGLDCAYKLQEYAGVQPAGHREAPVRQVLKKHQIRDEPGYCDQAPVRRRAQRLGQATAPYRAKVTPALRALADEVDRRQAAVVEADRLS